MTNNRKRLRKKLGRRGAATLEFALILPFFMALLLGVVELGKALSVSQRLITAAKSGARLASMDWTDQLQAGATANDKVITDIRNFLRATGLPEEEVSIDIVYAEGANEGQPFDLGDPNNDLELFRIELELEFSKVSVFAIDYMAGQNLREVVIQRAGRATMSN